MVVSGCQGLWSEAREVGCDADVGGDQGVVHWETADLTFLLTTNMSPFELSLLDSHCLSSRCLDQGFR